MEIKVGNRIRLSGLSSHGKNRVQEQGDWWIVKEIRASVAFVNWGPGPFALLTSANGHPGGLRWISINSDPNFKVEEVVPKESEEEL